MIRVLTMIAVAGFVLCVGSLAAAVAVGGPDALARGGWTFADDGGWGWGGRACGAHSPDLGLSADVRYEQSSSGPGSVEITGPTSALEHIVIQGDNLRYD